MGHFRLMRRNLGASLVEVEEYFCNNGCDKRNLPFADIVVLKD